MKRQIIMGFSKGSERYRVVALTNKSKDIEFIVEKFMYDVHGNENEVWVKVDERLADENYMTIEQCTQILRQVSDYIHHNMIMEEI